jgi:hypothetical protein
MAAAAGQAGMQGVVAGRPMPVSFDDFNARLDSQVDFFDADGNKVQCCFWAAIRNAQDSAQGLQERVVGTIAACRGEEAPITLLDDLATYQELNEQLERIVATAREVLQDFEAMRPRLDTTRKFHTIAKPIMSEGDIQVVAREVTTAANYTETNYLSEGRAYSYLPDHLKTLRAIVSEKVIGPADDDARPLETSDVN